MSDMGTFRVDLEVENPSQPGARVTVADVLVATGAELSCFPSVALESLGIPRTEVRKFRLADGTVIERWIGPAFIRLSGKRTSDDVIFAEPGDLTLLGARSLAGLNLIIDPALKRLIDAGPTPAATFA